MASITIKDFPVTLHEKLKSRAKQHRRSLNAEIITTLEQSIRLEETSVRHLIEKVRRFRSTLTFEATEAEISTAKRQGRS
jgi:plasmid stability protein